MFEEFFLINLHINSVIIHFTTMKRSFNSMLWQLFVVVVVVLFAPQAVSAQTVDELKRNAEQGDAYAQYSLGFCRKMMHKPKKL